MSIRPYPNYRDSGVEWIGAIPSSWTIKPLKRAVKLKTERADQHQFPVALENIEGWSGRFVEAAGIYESEGIAFGIDDILFGKLRPYLAKAWVADRTGEAVGDFHVLRPYPGHHSRFLQRFIVTREVISQLDGSTFGAKMPRVAWDFMGSLLAPIPPPAEQEMIVTFLDRETGKIDALVAEQKRLIALLQEKQQAVISQAVTKGLDPGAPMKPSGNEWLGDIPAHWQATPLMHLTDPKRPVMYGIVLPGPDVDEGIPILKGGNVKPSRMSLHEMARTTPAIEAPYARARLAHGDLVYSIRGTIGDCEEVPPQLEGSNITQDVARVAVREGVCAQWVRWALLSSPVRETLACGSLGAAVRGINIFDLKRVQLPTPPYREQEEIRRFIQAETSKLGNLKVEATTAINLLRERRSALISAAVTGKIDVRDFNEPVTEQVAVAA